ncbi:ATP-binding protein [archaeon]|nr:ATP-binding protein [archaeon]MBL7057495.1 ATP-binding protein [Candidatus Woesearchaeota archaeon]
MYDIVIGRNESDRKKFGTDGTILIGKHYVKMGRTSSLANKIYLDMIRSHIVFVCGKRGSGKSYTMGVIAEGVADLPLEIKQNISIIMLDTMGIYWTMKYPNKKDSELLEDWGLKDKGLDVKIYTPKGYYNDYKKKGIPTDYPFSVKPSELDADDWNITFGINPHEPIGVLIEKIIFELKDTGKEYDLSSIIKAITNDSDASIEEKNAAKNLFRNAENWGVFDKEGTPLKDLAKGGQVTVLDVSCYATMPGSWNIKNLVIGLVSQKLFIERMVARKNEEYQEIHKSVNYFGDKEVVKQQFPLVWLVIDEAHEFLPVKGKTMATDPLVTILREGRQPGISLILATQQPGKIHTDVMTQSDTVISHRITAKIDTEALGMLMQSYMREGLNVQLDNLPRFKGAAVIFDDTNEKMYPMRIRPRFTWHGGEAPSALHKKENIFED